MPRKRPNILYVFTDQQSWNVMSVSGNVNLHTPNMDRLAERGVRFERAYTSFPLCGPARASMFFGRYPHELGINANGQAVRDENLGSCLGELLTEAGYECAYGGKWHIPRLSLPGDAHGFRKICDFGDDGLANRCLEFFAEKRDRPWFLVASFNNPHDICQWGRWQTLPWTIGEPPTIEELPHLPANHAAPPYEPGIIRQWWRSKPQWRMLEDYSADQWRRYRWGYFRLVEQVDREIGRILDGLEREGLAEDTLVIFSSDHGDQQGAHQLGLKWTMYEESVRVPMIIAGKGVRRLGGTERALVNSCLDFHATVCDYAGVDPPKESGGLSLRPFLEDRIPERWRGALVAESNLVCGNQCGIRMVLTETHKYAVHQYGPFNETLFNLDQDPGEMVNLAVEARHRPLLQEHRELLAKWCGETKDDFGRHNSHPELPFIIPGINPSTEEAICENNMTMSHKGELR